MSEESKQTNILPRRLREVREALGISMAEASRRLNLSKIGYCRYEYGDREPSMQTIEVIAQCFKTSAAYLTGLTDDPSPKQIVVDKENTADLFELVNLCKDEDPELLKRIIAYYKEITR